MFTARDLSRLDGVHPVLVDWLRRVFHRMLTHDAPMFVAGKAVRTVAEQQALYAQGRTAPGSIVTHADGVHVRSNHQINPETGYGHAVDCAFIGPSPWDESHPWAVFGDAVRTEGLAWGGDWRKPDRPHVELPLELVARPPVPSTPPTMQESPMPIPDYTADVALLAALYPDEWTACHRGGPQSGAFAHRLASVLHVKDPKVGLNGKRGDPNNLSDDALCYDDWDPARPSGDTDPTRGGKRVTVIDFNAGAPRPGTSDPNGRPAWQFPLTPAHAAWVKPEVVVPGPSPTPTPTPTPVPSPVPQPVDLAPVLAELAELKALVRATHTRLDVISQNVQAGQAAAEESLKAVRALRAEFTNYQDRLIVHGLQVTTAGLLGRTSGTAKLPKYDSYVPPEREP